MPEEELSVTLVPAPDDLPVRSAEYQAVLETFAAALRTHGMKFSSRAVAFDSVGAVGYGLGEFFIVLKTIASSPLTAVIGTFLAARYGRAVKVEVTIRNITEKAASVDEVKKLLASVEEYLEYCDYVEKEETPHLGSVHRCSKCGHTVSVIGDRVPPRHLCRARPRKDYE